jgi:hypothetical protein
MEGGAMSKATSGEWAGKLGAYGCMTVVLGVIAAAVWWRWNEEVPKIREWAAPKPFATVDKDFKVGSQYRTLAECADSAARDARMFGSDSKVMTIPKGCVNLAQDPKRLVFTTPYVPSDWHLTFTHPHDPDNFFPNVDVVGQYPTLRDCLLAAIPLMPSDKKTMSEAGFDCEYGPAGEEP